MSSMRDCAVACAAFGAGIAIGGLAGLLLAPASGRELRRRMADRCDDERRGLLRKGQRAVEGAAHKLEGGIERGSRRLTEILQP